MQIHVTIAGWPSRRQVLSIEIERDETIHELLTKIFIEGHDILKNVINFRLHNSSDDTIIFDSRNPLYVSESGLARTVGEFDIPNAAYKNKKFTLVIMENMRMISPILEQIILKKSSKNMMERLKSAEQQLEEFEKADRRHWKITQGLVDRTAQEDVRFDELTRDIEVIKADLYGQMAEQIEREIAEIDAGQGRPPAGQQGIGGGYNPQKKKRKKKRKTKRQKRGK